MKHLLGICIHNKVPRGSRIFHGVNTYTCRCVSLNIIIISHDCLVIESQSPLCTVVFGLVYDGLYQQHKWYKFIGYVFIVNIAITFINDLDDRLYKYILACKFTHKAGMFWRVDELIDYITR